MNKAKHNKSVLIMFFFNKSSFYQCTIGLCQRVFIIHYYKPDHFADATLVCYMTIVQDKGLKHSVSESS